MSDQDNPIIVKVEFGELHQRWLAELVEQCGYSSREEVLKVALDLLYASHKEDE